MRSFFCNKIVCEYSCQQFLLLSILFFLFSICLFCLVFMVMFPGRGGVFKPMFFNNCSSNNKQYHSFSRKKSSSHYTFAVVRVSGLKTTFQHFGLGPQYTTTCTDQKNLNKSKTIKTLDLLLKTDWTCTIRCVTFFHVQNPKCLEIYVRRKISKSIQS